MKSIYPLLLLIMLTSCNSTQLVDTWKSAEAENYAPTKVLVVGITSNIQARQKFEKQLKDEYELRGIEAAASLEYFPHTLRTDKMNEAELKTIENKLIGEGFDSILLTKVVGIVDKVKYKQDYDGFNSTHKKFNEDFLMYQDIYFNSNYYEEYTVYHAETSLYCICPTKDRELIWKGYIDIIDPESIDGPINNYVKLLVSVLEKEQLINPKIEEKNSNYKETL